MDELALRKLRAARNAAWWTVLILLAWVMLGWIGLMVMTSAEPEIIRRMWGGGDLTWGEIQRVTLWFIGVMKMIMAVAVGLALWLTFYARGLARG
jgi:hypothetical protein